MSDFTSADFRKAGIKTIGRQSQGVYPGTLVRTPGRLAVTLPIRTVNEVNDHKHWRVRQKRAKDQRFATELCLRGLNLPALPCVVLMTRYGPRRIDSDSLPSCTKHIRDEIAALYGVDDGGDAIDWQYRQCPGERKGFSVDVAITSAALTYPPERDVLRAAGWEA